MFERLGSLTYRFRFVIVVAWVAAAIWAVFFAPSLAAEGMTDQTAFLPPYAASAQADEALERTFPGSTSVSSTTLVFSREGGLTDADHAYIEDAVAWMTGDDAPAVLRDAIASVDTASSRPELESRLRSEDGELEMVNVNLDVVMAGSGGDAVVAALRDHFEEMPSDVDGLVANVTGAGGIGSDYLAAIVAGTDSTTIVTVLLVLVILLVIYRAPLAAMIPLVTIGAAFVVARGTLGVLALAGWKVSSLIDTFIVVLIFGVGTDYAIFLISRFREEVAKGDWHDAARTTVGRIGAVISASAATVMVGLGAMAFGDFGMIQTTGPALAIGIFVTLIAGLTLTPALLGIFGHYLFWPRHTHAPGEGKAGGFFARLADAVSRRPGTVTATLLVVLVIPALFLPQMRTNFDVLAELPESSDARIGFDAVADHLGRGEVFQGTGIVDGGPGADLLEPASLARLLTLMQDVQETDGVGSVTSLVTPEGDGRLPDGFRPSYQLAEMADGFDGSDDDAAPADGEALLDPDVTDGLATMAAYLGDLGAAYPDLAHGTEMRAAAAIVAKAQDQVGEARDGAVVSTQLRSLADAMTSPAAAAGGDAGGATESIGMIGDYLDELAAAYPEVAALPAFDDAKTAVASLERKVAIGPALDLADALDGLATHFDGVPDATLFPESLAGTAEAKEARRRIEKTFDDLPASLDALAAVFAARTDDIFLPTNLGGEDGEQLADAIAAFVSDDGTATRFYVSTTDDPYAQEAFATVARVQDILTTEATSLGSGAVAYLGGTTAQYADIQSVLANDFTKVGIITILGILLVLMILLRAIVAPLYLVGTVLLSCATALGLSSWFFESVLGQPGVSFYLPILVFVLLVAIGSDYNIFLMSRVREESEGREIHEGIRIASGRTGAVITSAGLILAGTFAAMMTADLVILFQVGFAVAIGVLIDTFLVRSILVPAITTLFGERAWWPSGWAAVRTWPITVTIPEPGPGGRASRRRLAIALGVAACVPLLVAGVLAWSFNDPQAHLDRVTAAVVDLDEGTTVAGPDGTAEPLDLGAEIAARLTSTAEGEAFTWTAASADEAAAGLADGTYGAILTVPEGFSASVAAVVRGDADAEPANLELATDDAAGYALGTTARAVVEALAAETGRSVTADAVGRILRSVDTARTGLDDASRDVDRLASRSTDLADRAASASTTSDELVTGLGELADGMAAAGDGVGDLAGGVRGLAKGSDRLADGATSLASGVKAAAAGADALAEGARDLADGLAVMSDETAGLGAGAQQLDAGAQQTDSGAQALAGGAAALAGTAQTTATMAGQLQDAVTGYTGSVASLADGCVALGGGEPLCSQLQALAGGNDQLRQLAGGVTAYAGGVADGLANPDPRQGLAAGAAALQQGTAGVAAGTAALAASAPALEAGIAQAATGADAVADGAAKMAKGMGTLADGAKALGSGARAAATGADRLADGTSAAAKGADQIVAGIDGAAEGARLVAADVDGLASDGVAVADDAADLATGLADRSAELDVLPEHARDALDELVAAPVAVTGARLNAYATEGTALAPLLAALALWIGALAAFLVLPAFLGRRDTARPWRRALAGFGAAAILGIVQALLLVVALRLGVGIEVARLPELVAVAALAAVAFVAVNQALVALFDYRGWLVSLVLLAIQVAAVGALYPAATAPELLQLLRLVLPMAFAVDAFRALVAGGGPDLAPAVVGLVVWLVGSLVVTLAVAARSETSSAAPGATVDGEAASLAGA